MNNQLEDNLETIQQYAASRGITYEAVRAQIARIRTSNPEFEEYIKKIGRTQYITPDGVEFLDKRRNSSPVVIDSAEKNKRLKDLELENKELREDREKLRSEKEMYLVKLNELLEKGVDTTKYIAIEDHKKVEEELEQREQEIADLKAESEKAEEERTALEQKNDELEKDLDELRTVAVKVSTLTNEVNEKMKTINEKDSKIIELQEEKRRAEEEARKAEEVGLEYLQMGFFARRKKLKELKGLKNQ